MMRIIRSKRKSISICIEPDGNLLVRAPLNMPENEIRDFLITKRKWIEKNSSKIRAQLSTASSGSPMTDEEIKELKKKAGEIIPKRAAMYAKNIGVQYRDITVRLQRTRWGSASSKGNLSFNCLLMLVPQEVADSVIIHELCHLKQMNHSKRFYDEVLRYCPDYQKHARWLKENEFRLFARIPRKDTKGERQCCRIYYNGTVYCGGNKFCEGFAVKNGRFTKVGTTKELLKYAGKERDAEFTDLEGRFVCAGFNDSHMHLLTYGHALNSVMLFEHTGSPEDIAEAFRDFIHDKNIPEGAWVTGLGWNQDYFTGEKRLPERTDLDRASETHPIIAYRCCEHCIVVNTKALEVLGLTDNISCPEGGSIGMTGDAPNGLFFDNAISLVTSRMPPKTKEELKKYIADGCRMLNSYGITSCQSDDYSAFDNVPWQTVNEAYRELELEGKLTVRVTEQCNFKKPSDFKEFISMGNRYLQGSSMFRLGPLKVLGDGSLGARTARLSEPYSDSPSELGLTIYTQEEFDDFLITANNNGFNAAVHAIGDRTLDMVLDAYEKALRINPRPDHRHGIVHCQVTRPDQLERIVSLGLTVYAQTVFIDYDIHIVHDRIGESRAASSYSWKTLMKRGVNVSNGSDCPVEIPDVMRGIQCAVTRKSVRDGLGPYLPEQCFTVSEAIDSFTVKSAHQSCEENEKGLIAPGYLADFVILSENPFEVPECKISGIKPIIFKIFTENCPS